MAAPAAPVLQELDMLFHSPSRLVETILDRMADSREPFQVRGIESKETGIVGGFDDKRVAEIEAVTKLLRLANLPDDVGFEMIFEPPAEDPQVAGGAFVLPGPFEDLLEGREVALARLAQVGEPADTIVKSGSDPKRKNLLIDRFSIQVRAPLRRCSRRRGGDFTPGEEPDQLRGRSRPADSFPAGFAVSWDILSFVESLFARGCFGRTGPCARC